MSADVRAIMEQIDRLSESQRSELDAELARREREAWKLLAKAERQLAAARGLGAETEDDLDRACREVRQNGTAS